MAVKSLKSIKFPGLSDTYTFLQNDPTLKIAGAVADAKQTGDRLDVLDEAMETKAERDGYYQDMTVGDAEQLVSSQYVEDSVPYKYRTSGGSADVGNREYVDKIVGGTVAWNQMVHELSASYWRTASATASYSDGVATFTASERYGRIEPNGNTYRPAVISGHKYLFTGQLKKTTADAAISFGLNVGSQYYYGSGGIASTDWVRIDKILNASTTGLGQITAQDNRESGWDEVQVRDIMLFDLTQMFGSTIADAVYAMEQATAGAGVAWFRKLFPDDYYEYNAGELISVSGLQSHDMVGFNQWDEEWESYGGNQIRSKNRIKLISGATYYAKTPSTGITLYFKENETDSASVGQVGVTNGTFVVPENVNYAVLYTGVNYGTTYKNDICINLSWSGTRNGEYKPYEKHSYPLDSSLTLRGIPKLSAGNQLYFDGDEYLPEGKVNRRYGILDLGTLNWEYSQERQWFSCQNLRVKGAIDNNTVSNILCSKYQTVSVKYIRDDNPTFVGLSLNSSNYLIIRDTAYTDAATFKTAMSGVMLVYELATPTEETAESYNAVQLVDDWGTEEYVSGTICPVGHETRYPANLRDKLQHLPDLASADGYYVVQQTGSQMSLVHFRIPQAPSTDGTYTLKATVSGGTPTYTWEEVTE